MIPPDQMEVVDDFIPFGVHAFTTMRQVGSFSTGSDEPVKSVMRRWRAIRETVGMLVHEEGWEGWLRGNEADGHASATRGTGMAVTVADCVPVFLAHPSGASAILHSGWRGTAARIVAQGVAALTHRGFPAGELRLHLGPAICGKCYEVSPDVIRQVTGEGASAARPIDLRATIAAHARALGLTHITISTSCTRCHNDRFFSHRAGDAGRQVSVIAAAQ
jgi:YfiH family protein